MRNKKRLTLWTSAILCLLVVTLLFSSCAKVEPAFNSLGQYRIHTEAQANYLDGPTSKINNYAKGKKELSKPLPVVLVLSEEDGQLEKAELSESPTFENSFYAKIEKGKAEVYNLKIGTTYYYRTISTSGEKGAICSFETEEVCPRNLMIDGVTNARDLGGYQTAKGKIKQGLLFRTAKLNKNKTDAPTLLITQQGIDTMVNTLKVKTEVDLRETANNEIGSLTASVLGASVNYQNCPMTAESDMLTANDASLRKLFSLLADESNYPLFFHCSIGTDRTGYSAFLMLTLLGVSEEEVYRDYLFSNFGNIGSKRTMTNVSGFALFLALQEGTTQQERAENFLLGIGVTKEQISSFRRIMIENYQE